MKTKLLKKINEDSELKTNLEKIIINSTKIHDNRYLLSFSDHGIKHSNRMISALEKLCKKIYTGKDSLNKYELFILVAAIYLHDIGMQLYNDKELSLFADEYNVDFKKDEKEEFVRKYHASISKYWIEQNIGNENRLPEAYSGDLFLGEFVAKVVESHGIDFTKSMEYRDNSFNGSVIRLGLISSLLCIADTLDCDSRRVDIEKLKCSEISDDSKIHWFKHHYINSILIKENSIKIFYCFPVLNKCDFNNYKKYFTYQTEYWIKYCDEKYEEYYKDLNLHIKITREYNTSENKHILNISNYEYVQEQVVELYNTSVFTDTLTYSIAIGVLKKDNEVLLVKRRKPEGDLMWQFPTGQVKPSEKPAERVIEEFEKETQIKTKINHKLGTRLSPFTGAICYYFALDYIDGTIANGDVIENSEVRWVSISECYNLITTDIYTRVNDYLLGGSNG